MSEPIIVARNTYASTADESGFAYPMVGYGSVVAGDIAVVCITKDGSGAFTGTWPPTDWDLDIDQVHSSTHRVAVIRKVCTGAEGSTVTIGGPSENYTARGWLTRDSQGIRYETAVGNSTAANPPPILVPNRIRINGSTAIGFMETPNGTGDPDIQSICDLNWVVPGVTTAAGVAFDTYNTVDAGLRTDDWIGLDFGTDVEFRDLVFQEGPQTFSGGWFTAEPIVEVYDGATWTAVTGQTCTPPYAADNGIDCEIYIFTFDTVIGESIRIRGTPGGSSTFITAIELAANSNGPKEWGRMCRSTGAVEDTYPSRIALYNGGVSGSGPITAMNDTIRPAIYASTVGVSYDTYNGGGTARAQDWFGYWFGGADGAERECSRLIFQEGLEFGDGGAFASAPTVEYYNGTTWLPCTNVAISPTYGANNGIAFETYTLTFDTISCQGIRLIGDPFGTANFTSVAELEVYGPVEDVPCTFLYYVGIDGNSTASAHPSGWTNTGVNTTTDSTSTDRIAQAYGEYTSLTNAIDAAVLTNTSNPWVALSIGLLGTADPVIPPVLLQYHNEGDGLFAGFSF